MVSDNINHDLDTLVKHSESFCLTINPDKSNVIVFGRNVSKVK